MITKTLKYSITLSIILDKIKIIYVQRLQLAVLLKIKLYNMLTFHPITSHKQVPKLQLTDFNLTKEYMDSILMVITVLSTPKDSLTSSKNNLPLYTLQLKPKLTHTMLSLEDIILMPHPKFLKMSVGYAKDGMNNNLNL